MLHEVIATAAFGLEAVVRREIERLGFRVLRTEDGRVTFATDERGIVRANLWLRAADRVLLKLGEFRAVTFEDLFQQVRGIAWEQLIPPQGEIRVSGASVKSALHSVPACQRVAKKAILARLGSVYATDTFPESGPDYDIKISILKDLVTVTADTSGEGLHKRGYRVATVAAPLKETLAAALVELSFWKPDRLLVDPCCGSGTILIEAALIGRNIAPGLNRHFAGEDWDLIDARLWKEERRAAYGAMDYSHDMRIRGFDIDGRAVLAARENAAEAGVGDCVSFRRMDMVALNAEDANGIIITNPPYGERIGEREQIEKIYDKYSEFIEENPSWSLFMITEDRGIEERIFARPADRRRKLYNGRLETCYYQFHGRRIKADKGL